MWYILAQDSSAVVLNAFPSLLPKPAEMVLDICVLRCIYLALPCLTCVEFLVTVSIKKVGDKWWYNSYRKCSHTTVAHADSFRCTNRECGSMAVPNPRLAVPNPRLLVFVLPLPPVNASLGIQDRYIEHAQSSLLYALGTGYFFF